MTTRWLVGLLAVLSATSTTATALTPVLVHWPLVLAGLAPRAPFLFLAAGHTPFSVFLVVATARLLVADPIHYALGRRHGADRVHPRIQRAVGRVGLVAVALKPNGPVLAAAGAGRLDARWVMLADVFGTVLYVLAIHRVAA